MENNWVDFKAIKAAVTMQMILDRYQINWLRKSGEELRGRCPIHDGEGNSAFHVSLTKNAFHCFSCKAKGNVLDFVSAMEKCSVRDAAVRIADWFTIGAVDSGVESRSKPGSESPVTGESAQPCNKPLTFHLKGIDHGHPYLAGRGVSREVAERFGVGYFSGKGSMSGRVVIPIHNERGELVAYAGRAIDDSEPRYKLPAGFHKSIELYNLARAIEDRAEDGRVVVVEGFFGCVRIRSAGFACVALMGSSLSASQEELIARHFSAAWLMFDGNEAGKNCTNECLGRLSRRMWVRGIELAEGQQPDNLMEEDIRRLLGG